MLSCLWDGAYIRSLMLIGYSGSCSGGNGFPLSLSGWPFVVYRTPYNCKDVQSASLNKTFPSFLHSKKEMLI